MQAVGDFDLDRYLRASKRVDLTGVEWDRIGDHPLPPEQARCLAYMMDIESHTVVFLRDLLATRAAYEPDVTAFLSCWVYEELWHGEAFSRFLGEAGYELAPGSRAGRGDAAVPDAARSQRVDPPGDGRQGLLSPPRRRWWDPRSHGDFVALHMTWGAANELTTPDGLPPPDRENRAPAARPPAAGDHQGRTPPLRLLPGAGSAAAGSQRHGPVA